MILPDIWSANWATTVSASRVLGLDFSKYQGNIDLNKAISAGAEFFFCRVGGGYKDNGQPFIDDLWNENAQKLTDCGKPWAGYWYFIPKNIQEQADWLLDEILFHDYWMPLAIDCEKWWTSTAGLTPTQASDALEEFGEILTTAGLDWQIYTRKSFWDLYYASRPAICSHDLWVAHWDTDTPAIPNTWTTWRFHQWSGDGNGRGAEFGAESNAIDLDYFNGDMAAFRDYLGLSDPYPFIVNTLQNTVIRLIPDSLSSPMWVAPVNTRLGVIGSTNDTNDKLWFDIGSGWVRAGHTDKVQPVPPVDPPAPPAPPDPPAPPPPDADKTFLVTAGKALARFIHSYNDAGKPIMQIYPGDSITEGRVKYLTGNTIAVLPSPIRADGGGDYYEIVTSPVAGIELFLRASDGVVG